MTEQPRTAGASARSSVPLSLLFSLFFLLFSWLPSSTPFCFPSSPLFSLLLSLLTGYDALLPFSQCPKSPKSSSREREQSVDKKARLLGPIQGVTSQQSESLYLWAPGFSIIYSGAWKRWLCSPFSGHVILWIYAFFSKTQSGREPEEKDRRYRCEGTDEKGNTEN